MYKIKSNTSCLNPWPVFLVYPWINSCFLIVGSKTGRLRVPLHTTSHTGHTVHLHLCNKNKLAGPKTLYICPRYVITV